MKKRIILHDDSIDILEDEYNIIDQTIYDPELANKIIELLKDAGMKGDGQQ